MAPQRSRSGFMGFIGPLGHGTLKYALNTYSHVYDLASDILTWLYLFAFFLCFYSLKLFFQNMFLCYLILFLFIVTSVILFYSNLQKINEQGFSSLKELQDPMHRPSKPSGVSSTRKSRVSAIIENKVSITRFAFTDSDNWQKEISLLKCNNQRNNPQSDSFFSPNMTNDSSQENFDEPPNNDKNRIYPESAAISSGFDSLIDLLLDNFVKNWYTRIHDLSSSPQNSDLFTDELKVILQNIIKQLFKEFSSVDLANLIILTILPILTNHFNSYIIAKNITQSKNDCVSNISSSFRSGSNNNNSNKNSTNMAKKKKNITDNEPINSSKNDTENFSQNWNLAISKNYNHHGKLHPVINKFRDNDEFIALNCKNHLRTKLNKLLPVLLHSDRKLSNCLPIVLLLREILINYVLFPTLKKISDPDFYNRQVVDRIGNSIADRNKVNQLRAELQKHSKTLKHNRSMVDTASSKNDTIKSKNTDENAVDTREDAKKNENNKDSKKPKKSTNKRKEANHSSNELLQFKLILSTGQQSFESFLKKVQSNQSLVDLRQLKFYVNLQLQRTFRNEEFQKLEKLFDTDSNDLLNNENNSGESASNLKKLKELYYKYKTLIKRLQTVQCIINEKIQQSNVNSNDDADSIHSKQSSNYYNNRNASRLSTTSSIPLTSLLNDPLLLSYYMEYMELQHKLIIVQFWLNVNGIKDPLENLLMIDSNDIYNDDISVNSVATGNTDNNLNNADEKDVEMKIDGNNFFNDFISSSNDIRTIFNTYFHNSLIVTKNKVIYSNVSNFVQTYEKYFSQNPPIESIKQTTFNDLENKLSKARKSILVSQAEIYQVMENDLPNFYKSNTYLKLLANENWNPLNHTMIEKEKDQVSISSFSSDQDSNLIQTQAPFKSQNSTKIDDSDFSEPINEINGTSSASSELKISRTVNGEITKKKMEKISQDSNDTKGKKRLGIVSPNDKDTFFGNNDDLIVSKDVIDAVENVLTKLVDSSNNSSSNIDKMLDTDSKPKKIDTTSIKNSLLGISNEKDVSESSQTSNNKTEKINSDDLFDEKLSGNILEETDPELSSDWEDEEAELDSMLYDMISAESDPRSDNANIAAAATLSLQNDKKNNSRHDGIIVKPPPLFDINFTNPSTSLKDLQLNLSGEILRLGNEIDDLNNQTEILKPLIQKAELTNNTAELRILNKASSSLLRELNLKSLQRQQYIVQENENNLFGKATVNITGYMSKVDESTNKEYTSYIIEVRKATSASTSDTSSNVSVNRRNSDNKVKSKDNTKSDNNETLKLTNSQSTSIYKDGYVFYSTWVVSRRFSLFYMLHQYLKSLYPNVKDLYFPSKKLNISLLQSTSKKFQEQQTNLIETRKKYLSEYLKNLLVMPEICEDSIFRLFLSSQRFNTDIFSRMIKISKNKKMEYIEMEQAANPTDKKNSNFSTGNSFEDVTAKLYNGLANGLFFMGDNSFMGNSTSSFSSLNEDGKKIPEVANEKLNDAFEMQNELNSYDYGLKPFTTTTSSGKMTTSSKVSGSTLAVNKGQISSSGIFSSNSRNLRQRNGNFFSNYYNKGVVSKINRENLVENNLNPMILSKSIPFVKPICDLILSIFKLNNRANSWLRGRAILVLLQRLFGSTIEKKIREFFGESSLRNNESKIVDLLQNIKTQFFPNGKFQGSSDERSKEEVQNEKQKNKREAKELLEIFITDISSKIVGIKSSKFASLEIHNLFQNEILNTHLVYTMFDEILDSVFSELSENDGEQESLNFS